MTLSALRWFKAALVMQLLLVAYWLTIQVVDLSPWNDVAAGRTDDALRFMIAMTALPLIALAAIFALGLQTLGLLSVAGYVILLAVQLWAWWKPYAWGANSEEQAAYAASLAKTLKVLPAYGTHLPPDAQHIVLHVLIAVTLFVTAMAVARMRHL
jgi:hypothetical protein